MVGGVDAHGQLTQSTIFRNPRTKYERSNNVFLVTNIALDCAHFCTRLLQPLAQSLIGSPGTLFEHHFVLKEIAKCTDMVPGS